MIARASFVVFIALVAGCSNLEDLDRDRCGNGIIERGEDCDSSDARCVSCGIRCEDGACAYPGAEGFVCGADDFCHAPAGTFKAPSELSAAVETFRVTDVDHDGIGDLLVQAPTSVQVFYGSADGAPTAMSSTLTPIARGPAAYVDLDVDGSLDLLLPTDDGIAAYTSTYGQPSPYPFPSTVAALGAPLSGHKVSGSVMGFIGSVPSLPNVLGLAVFDVTTPNPTIAFEPLCGAIPADFKRINHEVINVPDPISGQLGLHQIVVVTLDTSPKRLCVLAIDFDSELQRHVIAKLDAPNLIPKSRPVLAALKEDCPSLFLRARLPTPGGDDVVVELAGTPGTGASPCGFGPPVARPVLVADVAVTTTPIGWLPLVPPIGTANHAIVMSTGVFVHTGTALRMMYQSDRPLAMARATDIDDDGDIDLVASGSSFGGDGAEDLDVLYRRLEPGIPDPFLQHKLLRYRYDTAGPVSFIEIADVDGNDLPDVVFVQQRDRDGRESSELAVAYGTRDQLLAPVAVGTFAEVLSIVPAGIPDSNDPASLIDDLIVLFKDGTGDPQVTLLHGSTQRVLNAYFDPRTPDQAHPDPTNPARALFRGVVGGRFYTAPTATEVGVDLLALATVGGGIDGTSVGLVNRTDAWISDNASGGVIEPIGPVPVPGVASCAPGTVGTGASLCLHNTQYVAVPRTDVAHDWVIGVDGDGYGLTIAPGIVSMDTVAVSGDHWDLIAAEVAGGALRSLELVELDSGPRLIAAFAGTRSVVVCPVDRATGRPSACMDVAAEVARSQQGAAYTCVDAAPARVTPHARFSPRPSPPVELLALCHARGDLRATIFRLTEVAEGFAAWPLLEVDPAQELRTGDINGDGIDDLVTVNRAGSIPTFRLYMQCTSRESVGCGSAP